ncbi:hypothetical protein CBOM_04209 [Ceraceosorus bombacis]|uniref:Uncharacterized protein n=1 Tax=Ceraceosorus bombacis TaxID=401625 RepID=A0A0P1BLY4_9BASI|nr:hypothetical protein CBOM_04209 [Ceraceosorus bombacis]
MKYLLSLVLLLSGLAVSSAQLINPPSHLITIVHYFLNKHPDGMNEDDIRSVWTDACLAAGGTNGNYFGGYQNEAHCFASSLDLAERDGPHVVFYSVDKHPQWSDDAIDSTWKDACHSAGGDSGGYQGGIVNQVTCFIGGKTENRAPGAIALLQQKQPGQWEFSQM